MHIRRLLVLVALLSFPFLHLNATPPATGSSAKASQPAAGAKRSPEISKLAKEAEKLKQDLVELNRELYDFEERLLYPTETQLAVFLSLRSDTTFTIDSVGIILDGKLVATHLYEESELEALKKGGIQKVYLGSLADGRHKLKVQLNGQAADKSYFRRKKELKFSKENKAKYIQMEISENSVKREPSIKVKQW